eukprot:CAMPEP_0184487870 /NCGR_PEP_ID=MMETSP0113_2-20130426/10383_1 /TAXON_ID=91329 /ORGANISM="Norrisiella sphaerica, Strain BC52" /LENGTH=640 /DNA_ID=CAMNT_0026870293 /DNA_START=359 /DNA_END=2281 /DNA_ORIENTATION=-
MVAGMRRSAGQMELRSGNYGISRKTAMHATGPETEKENALGAAFLNMWNMFRTGRVNAAATATDIPTEVEMPTMKPSERKFGGKDWPKFGQEYLPEETIERAKAGNKIEKIKLAKCGTSAFQEVHEFAAAIREGKTTWEELDIDDADVRLKWAGLFHRRKRTPGRFMMRLKVPNGYVNSDHMRFFADSVGIYPVEVGVIDITTRQNIQLRGLELQDMTDLIDGLAERGLSNVQSGMDNVRNLVGSPIAGIDPEELIDTWPIAKEIDNMVTNHGKGNPKLASLPRKFNIAVSGSRDDFAHTSINDIGLRPCPNKETGEMGFNVIVGGYFSIKRVMESIPMNMWVKPEDAADFCETMLMVFRDHGSRGDRQKARLIWLIEDWGMEKFREKIIEEFDSMFPNKAGALLEAQPEPWAGTKHEKRDLMGVFAQKQDGLSFIGVNVPAGRILPDEARALADIADKYSGGDLRLTVEQNIIFPNVANDKVDAFLKEPLFNTGKFVIPKSDVDFPLSRGLVSCTGAQFCGIALIETKNRAVALTRKLEQRLSLDRPVRIHWTGCPNSCGQAQVADIGLMGAPARVEKEVDGKLKKVAVEGVNIFLGGKVGEDPFLGEVFKKGIPADEEYLLPVMEEILKTKFGATEKA